MSSRRGNVERTCAHCGRKVWRSEAEATTQRRFFCGNQCHHLWKVGRDEHHPDPPGAFDWQSVVEDLVRLRKAIDDLRTLSESVTWRIQQSRRWGPRWGIMTLDEAKANHVEAVLDYTKGNKMAAARLLGINVKTLYNMRRKVGLVDYGWKKKDSEE